LCVRNFHFVTLPLRVSLQAGLHINNNNPSRFFLSGGRAGLFCPAVTLATVSFCEWF